jgi:hypothetical protein
LKATMRKIGEKDLLKRNAMKRMMNQALVAHTCSPSYSGSRD